MSHKFTKSEIEQNSNRRLNKVFLSNESPEQGSFEFESRDLLQLPQDRMLLHSLRSTNKIP